MKKFLFLALAFFVVGCLNYEQETHIYKDGSGKMTLRFSGKLPDSTTLKMMSVPFDADSLRKHFEKPFVHIEQVESVKDTVDSTITSMIRFKFDSVDSLNKLEILFSAHSNDFSFVDGAPGQKVFSQFIHPPSTGYGFDKDSFYVTYKYTFNGEVVQHNAVKIEGNTYIWKYKMSEIGNGKTISVTFIPYKLKETPVWIYYLAGAVLLFVLIFLLRKKKD